MTPLWRPSARPSACRSRCSTFAATLAPQRASPSPSPTTSPAVLALGAKAAWTAREVSSTVPVVFALVRDPSRYGLERPNMTGVGMNIPPAMALAQFQLFAPEAERGHPPVCDELDPAVGEAIQAAREAGYTVIARRVSSDRDVRRQLAAMARDMDAIWLLPDPLIITPDHFHLVRTMATRTRTPVLAYSETLVEAGAFLCVAPDREAIGRLAAQRIQAVLEPGATPAALPLVVPQEFRVVLNRDTQQALGLDIDPHSSTSSTRSSASPPHADGQA